MNKKLFKYALAVSLLAALITGIVSFIQMRTSLIEETENSAVSMAIIALHDILEDEATDYDKKAKDLANSLAYNGYRPYRITIIDESGTVLGDSEADIEEMDNHADRPEIAEAKINGVGNARRHSDTLKITMLYSAAFDEISGITVRVALPMVEFKKITSNLVLGLVISVSSGIVISVIVALIFSDRIAKPINILTQASYELAGGNLRKRVEINTSTELDQLANAYNTMAGKLHDSLLEIRKTNEEFDAVLSSIHDGMIAVNNDKNLLYVNTVARDLFNISEKDNLKSIKIDSVIYQEKVLSAVDKCVKTHENQSLDLRLGTEQLKDYRVDIYPMTYASNPTGAIIVFNDITRTLELEKLRSDFVANVSHELRTPLTSIKGYAETLKEDGFADEKKTTRFLDIIEIEAERLNLLINDLMELSKIENIKEDMNISECDFGSILEDTIEVVSLTAHKKNIVIEKDVADKIIINANKDRIKQLLLNLVDNAIKYNKEGGRVKVSAQTLNNMLKISVKDTGEGIDKEDLSRLFERFYRTEKSRSKELGGTGLGLSIVKHIAELYGGSVTVTSEKGKGSEFVVSMPIVKE